MTWIDRADCLEGGGGHDGGGEGRGGERLRGRRWGRGLSYDISKSHYWSRGGEGEGRG